MVKKRWIIVGFKHPDNKRSIIYKQNITTEQLIKTIEKYAAKCNLFSIRGFEEEE